MIIKINFNGIFNPVRISGLNQKSRTSRKSCQYTYILRQLLQGTGLRDCRDRPSVRKGNHRQTEPMGKDHKENFFHFLGNSQAGFQGPSMEPNNPIQTIQNHFLI